MVCVSVGAAAVDASTMMRDVLICGLGASCGSGDIAVVGYLLSLTPCP